MSILCFIAKHSINRVIIKRTPALNQSQSLLDSLNLEFYWSISKLISQSLFSRHIFFLAFQQMHLNTREPTFTFFRSL